MTEQEKINAETQRQLAMQDAKFNTFMQEMRDRDNQRAAEIRELRQKQEADMKEIRQDMKTMQANLDAKIDGISKHVQNVTVAAMVGVGTSIIAVVVLVGTTIYALLSH